MVEATKFYVGQLFESYFQFITALKAYEQEHFVCFSKCDTRQLDKIAYIPKNPIKHELKYCRVRFICVRGGRFCHRGTGKRKTSTLKIGCPALIYLCCTRDGKHLEIRRLIEDHNHEVSEEAFNKLPQQRRLPPDLKKNAKEMLDMRVNKRMLLQKLQKETGKKITIKYLHNLANQQRLKAKPEETMVQQGYISRDVAETYTKKTYVPIAPAPDPDPAPAPEAEEIITNDPVSEDTGSDDKMVFIQNKANKAVEDLVREKKRSNDLKERLLEESRKRNAYLETLLKSNDTKEQLLEESRRRNKYLEILLKLECINYNQSLKEPMQE